jgi:hypothetical protein
VRRVSGRRRLAPFAYAEHRPQQTPAQTPARGHIQRPVVRPADQTRPHREVEQDDDADQRAPEPPAYEGEQQHGRRTVGEGGRRGVAGRKEPGLARQRAGREGVLEDVQALGARAGPRRSPAAAGSAARCRTCRRSARSARPGRGRPWRPPPVAPGPGSLVPGLVSSIAIIAPRPRTSPMTGYWARGQLGSRGSMISPISRALPARSCSRIVSIAPSAAAQATGLPP